MFAFLALSVLQTAPSQPWTLTTQGWRIDQSTAGCVATDGSGVTLAAAAPDSPVTLDLKVPQWAGRGPVTAVEVQRAGDLPRIAELPQATFDGQRLRLALRPGEASALVSAPALTLKPLKPRGSATTLQLPQRTRVLALFQRCLAENARRDPGSGQPVATPGARVPGSPPFIQDGDYPPEALRAGVGGRTEVRLTVSAKGLVSDCAIARSSGTVALDETSCILVSRRARFTPALDAAGRPTQAVYQLGVAWSLAE